jgi:hypothetical protein
MELLGVRVFIWPRELSCEAWATFYRWMERGSIPSLGPSGSPRRTQESLVYSALPSLFHLRTMCLEIFLMSYPLVGPSRPLARG